MSEKQQLFSQEELNKYYTLSELEEITKGKNMYILIDNLKNDLSQPFEKYKIVTVFENPKLFKYYGTAIRSFENIKIMVAEKVE